MMGVEKLRRGDHLEIKRETKERREREKEEKREREKGREEREEREERERTREEREREREKGREERGEVTRRSMAAKSSASVFHIVALHLCSVAITHQKISLCFSLSPSLSLSPISLSQQRTSSHPLYALLSLSLSLSHLPPKPSFSHKTLQLGETVSKDEGERGEE